jgi:formate dehydrogenase (NADP+) beta subunit
MAEASGKYQVKIPGIEDYQALTACQSACPLGTDTKGYVRAIAEGDYDRAYLLARQSNPLVSVCSRVCTAPCEKNCRKGGEGAPVDIRALKRFACDRHGVATPHVVEQKLDELSRKERRVRDRIGNHILNVTGMSTAKGGARVAIIGSGPTGLAAAHDLALLGYQVTIFEAGPLPGGQLRSGIPGFRLPKELLQQEIDAILALGVELKLNSPIGSEITLAGLRGRGFQSIFITIGLQDPMALDLPGKDLRGVYSGIDYVRDHARIHTGRSCLVIGGGGVAIDCAQHAIRQGAEQVMIACLESWESMPASLADKEDAQEEGIEFLPSLGPQRVIGEEGRAAGVEFLAVDSIFDSEGRFRPSYLPGSNRIVKADTVILAVGQSSTLPKLSGMDGLEMTANGLIVAKEDMSTNIPGVFAGGDVRWRFARNATDGIADGQKAARAIHGFLRGKPLQVKKRASLKAVPEDFLNTRCETISAARVPKRDPTERIRSGEEITLGFDEAQAREQAARCRQCNMQTVFDSSRCLLCGTCADGCVRGALKLVHLDDLQGDERLEKVTRTLAGSASRGRTAIIKDDSRCASCGICALRCPGGAITMAEFTLQEEWE